METPLNTDFAPAASTETVETLDTGSKTLAANFIAAHAQSPLVPPTGGDFHAAFPLKDDAKVAFVLGDVAGHGAEAAVQAEYLKEAITGCLDEGLTPSDALGFVNAAAEMDPEFPGFATVIAGTVETETGHIEYASGGHEPALLAAPTTAAGPSAHKPVSVQELIGTGPPVGAFPAEEVRYESRQATLPPGGTLLLYSDGLTEARRGRAFLGVERLRAWLVRFLPLSPARLVRKLLGQVRAFAGTRKLRDDAALLALRRRPKRP
ncbi:MAG: serine/threonine-protein phosphatase [Cytophagales bacterium]|nr:serine/threonine-protein phosphatase [Armatimonadota bacterium]